MWGMQLFQFGLLIILINYAVYAESGESKNENSAETQESDSSEATDGSEEKGNDGGSILKPLVEVDDNKLTELCEKSSEDIIAYPQNPQHYVVCLVQPPHFGDCGKGMCFDKTTTKCQACHADTTLCLGKTLFEKVSDNCESYYLCTKDKPLLIECPSTQHYSETEEKCVPAIEADCLPFGKWCRNKPNGLRFESPNCYEYYECQDEQIHLKACAFNEHFHKANSTCVTGFCTTTDDGGAILEREPICSDAMDGLKFIHPKCYKYYVCLNSIAYVDQCPTGYYFNANSKKCVADTNGICNDD
ncbi:uncharacterized protein [Musca autumnalis]|uniref:uncharacterized protein n=1 Tax=Musca autumnalis TaxID=221902 RepID=UPI003CEDB4DB